MTKVPTNNNHNRRSRSGLLAPCFSPRRDPLPLRVRNRLQSFDSDGKMKLPTGYREWVFVGAPLTPNGLNNGKANFPEYHHVYVEEKTSMPI